MNWSQLPQEYKDLANADPKAYIQDSDEILYRFIISFLPKGVDFWVKCWEAKTVNELPPILNDDEPKDKQKDVALFVAFFYYHSYMGMGLFSTFDTVYDLAIQFVEKYPPKTNWEESDTDYETTAHQFLLDNFLNKKI